MDSLDSATLGTIAAIVAFLYSYIKDRHESGKAIGKLEERVANLETKNKSIELMSENITDIRVEIARLSQELSTVSEWVRNQQNQ